MLITAAIDSDDFQAVYNGVTAAETVFFPSIESFNLDEGVTIVVTRTGGGVFNVLAIEFDLVGDTPASIDVTLDSTGETVNVSEQHLHTKCVSRNQN